MGRKSSSGRKYEPKIYSINNGKIHSKKDRIIKTNIVKSKNHGSAALHRLEKIKAKIIIDTEDIVYTSDIKDENNISQINSEVHMLQSDNIEKTNNTLNSNNVNKVTIKNNKKQNELRVNKEQNIDALINTIEESGFICFADFEFTCGDNITMNKTEILSVGIIICDGNYNIVDSYYNTCKPIRNAVLTDECTNLTHLEQTVIYRSLDSNIVFYDIQRILIKYHVQQVIVYGNSDAIALRSDAKIHKKQNMPYSCIEFVGKKIVDIQTFITDKLLLPSAVRLSILSTTLLYKNENGGFHNALNDARALYHVYKTIRLNKFEMCNEFTALREQRLDAMMMNKEKKLKKRYGDAFNVPLCENEVAYYNEIMQCRDVNKLQLFIMNRDAVIKVIKSNTRKKKFIALLNNSDNTVFMVMPYCKYEANKFSGLDIHEVIFYRNGIDLTQWR